MSDNSSMPILEIQGLAKSFMQGGIKLEILKDINLQVSAQECIAIVGASGSGKSTLLHCLGGLEQPNSGQVLLKSQNIHQLKPKAQGRLRNQALGFVYQFHHLLQELTALENVAMPLLINGQSVATASLQAANILERVGLKQRLDHKPAQLSGGERQRAAIARALVHKPDCVLADEPTGNLDRRTAEQVYKLMLEVNQEAGTSLILVTHDFNFAKRMDRVLQLEDGVLVDATSFFDN
ncbi:lipoprotein ABC transporter ATP-binding protein [Achromatium sp. WMS3]|nr:lipoprotein ABC transporter ATP-binding protein [Achromatium sp. WMS3]